MAPGTRATLCNVFLRGGCIKDKRSQSKVQQMHFCLHGWSLWCQQKIRTRLRMYKLRIMWNCLSHADECHTTIIRRCLTSPRAFMHVKHSRLLSAFQNICRNTRPCGVDRHLLRRMVPLIHHLQKTTPVWIWSGAHLTPLAVQCPLARTFCCIIRSTILLTIATCSTYVSSTDQRSPHQFSFLLQRCLRLAPEPFGHWRSVFYACVCVDTNHAKVSTMARLPAQWFKTC